MVADVEIPAGFVPQYAMAFGAVDGPALAVHAGNPLPVCVVRQSATTPPLVGSLTASGRAGPYLPELDRPIWLTLSGRQLWRRSIVLVPDPGQGWAMRTILDRPGYRDASARVRQRAVTERVGRQLVQCHADRHR